MLPKEVAINKHSNQQNNYSKTSLKYARLNSSSSLNVVTPIPLNTMHLVPT